MWSFSEVIDGMAEACEVFATPVVSGNVSFYNETEGRGILPTPVIGMIGLIDDVRRVVQHGFKQTGDVIALLGVTADDLSLSEYLVTVEGISSEELIGAGRVPVIDLQRERVVQAACLEAAESGLLRSAHDCSDGGLAVAIAECCFSSLNRSEIGADVETSGPLGDDALLFSESPSRIIISFEATSRSTVEEIAGRWNCPFTIIGRTGGDRLRIKANGEQVVDTSVAELEAVWRNALSRKLKTEAMAAGME
jgi:phosphoribosylformylglycinamidine synthase